MLTLGEAAMAARLIQEEIAIVLCGEFSRRALRALVKGVFAVSED